MKNEYDAGTPELQAHKSAAGLKRKGLDYLFRRGTLTVEQYQAGVHYRTCFLAMHGGSGYRSCLAAHFTPEDTARDRPSEYWEKLMGMKDAATWHSRISGMLARYAFINRKPYHKIVEHIAGHDDWNLEDVALHCGITNNRKTPSRYVTQAFDALEKIIQELVNEWGEENRLQMTH